MSKNENKQTILESMYAFDAAPAVMESIMNQDEIKYGFNNDDDDDSNDTIVNENGEVIFDPSHLMDVNAHKQEESGPRFNSDVNPLSEDDKDFALDTFGQAIVNMHHKTVGEDELEVANVMVQLASDDPLQDFGSFIQDSMDDAAKRLSGQNTSEVLPDGTSADMTGDDMIPADDNVDLGMSELGQLGGEEKSSEGFSELPPTTQLTPEEDKLPDSTSGLGDINLGLDDAPTEQSLDGASAETPEEDTTGTIDTGVNPFDDLNMGDGTEDTENTDEPSAEATEPSAEEPEASTEGEQTEEKDDTSALEDITSDKSNDSDLPSVNLDEPLDMPSEDENADEDKKDANFESVMARVESLSKKYKVKAQCEAIVAEANKKIAQKAQFEAAQRRMKAKCESIISNYGRDTARKNLKAKLESISNKYKAQVAANRKVKAQCEAITNGYINSVNNERKLKAQCEAIIANYKAKKDSKSTIKSRVDSILNKYAASV